MIPSRSLLLRIGLIAAAAAGAPCRDVHAQHLAPPPDASRRIVEAPATRVVGSAFISASPLISRGKRVLSWSPLRFAEPRNVNDGNAWTAWGAGKPTPERPAWIAIDVGKGPARVLLTWSAGGSFNYAETDYGSPGAYRIETSPDSTDGVDGSWRVAVDVASVITHGQAHSFDFAGQRWIKVVVTRAPAISPNGVQIDEIGVHDASMGADDTWIFMGDSITAMAFGRPPAPEPGFAARVHQRHPRYYPAVLNAGIGGEKSDEGASHIDEWIRLNPDARFWALGYGTNDAAGDAGDTSRFRANLQTIIDRVRAAGRVPILATIPFASDGHHRHIPRFNDAIEELQRVNALPPGPDLYAWFVSHPDELRDGVHPDERGVGAINRLWAEAVDRLYAP